MVLCFMPPLQGQAHQAFEQKCSLHACRAPGAKQAVPLVHSMEPMLAVSALQLEHTRGRQHAMLTQHGTAACCHPLPRSLENLPTLYALLLTAGVRVSWQRQIGLY